MIDSTPPSEDEAELPKNDAQIQRKVAKTLTQNKRLPGNDEDPSEASDLDYDREKRLRRRGFRSSSSSSESDSSSSCFSGQSGGRRKEIKKSTSTTSRSNRSKSTGKNSQSKQCCVSYKVDKSSVPLDLLHADKEEVVVSLMSNYHVSTRLESKARHRPRRKERNHQSLTSRGGSQPYILSWERGGNEKEDCVGGDPSWMDDIIERSVTNFKRKFPKTNPGFSDGQNNPSITQNTMCSVVL